MGGLPPSDPTIRPECTLSLEPAAEVREEADYAPAFVVDDAGVREDLEASRGFVARIRTILEATRS